MRTVISKNLAKANQTDKTVEIGLDIDSTVATVENRIKEQKLGFNLDKLPVRNKEGNEVYILLVALAYNILNWFKRFLLPEEFRSRCIKWIRMYLLNLPAIIQRKKKQYFIKFSKFYPYKELFDYIFRELAKGKPYYVV